MVLALPSKQIQAKSNPTTAMFRSAKILRAFFIYGFLLYAAPAAWLTMLPTITA